ncbi:hypothetical protein LFL96_06110 [Paraburkholderia sp. D15]|uniref:hypothetical protein n=1 Tax=Paraburkholderia sp. D15 TaxID=2880218 RepID=UPI0024790818|nr:hypothetical protein [Paraburkholderia sp. D15]WGS51074.1 hypothetical protein LFL96_06110 [Paraburkholderia sp. D15]WKF59057.1 hypothetical protein HUO10_003565 [Paraburkholderia busanensis]
MNTLRGLDPADRQRLDALIRQANAQSQTALTAFITGGFHAINGVLRAASPPSDPVRRFLDELRQAADYTGTSYRVSYVMRAALAALQRGHARQFTDLGAQCAFVLPRNAAAWALRATRPAQHAGLCELYSIFDESVPQKNLSTDACTDLVVVPPGTRLRVKALRLVAIAAPAGDGRQRAIVHFAHAAADTGADAPCAACYDLFGGARVS